MRASARAAARPPVLVAMLVAGLVAQPMAAAIVSSDKTDGVAQEMLMTRQRNVHLRFRRMDFVNACPLTVVEVDEGGEIVKYGSIPEVAEWLKLMGYRYVTGTNGRWAQRR